MSVAVVVLAAGKGTRMESDLAKVLHPLAGRPLVHWVLAAVSPLQPAQVVVIVGHQAERVEKEVTAAYPNTSFAVQPAMLGTGHAVMQAEAQLRDFMGDIIVICGDTPLIETATLQKLVALRQQNNSGAALLVCELDEAGAYGRVVLGEDKSVTRIVEVKDATAEELEVRTVNAGTYSFDAQLLWHYLARIGNTNKAGEYYLTDVIGLMTKDGQRVDAVQVNEREMTGVNTRAQLAELEASLTQASLAGDGSATQGASLAQDAA